MDNILIVLIVLSFLISYLLKNYLLVLKNLMLSILDLYIILKQLNQVELQFF